MIRYLVLLLVLANAAFFAWQEGWLASAGLAPRQQREPERLSRQIKPESVVVLNTEDAKRAELAANKPPECLVSEPLSDTQANALRDGMAAFATNWQIDTQSLPERWIVYMGKYPNAEALAKKKDELRALGLSPDNLRNASLQPGLSLGAADNQADAQSQLADLARRGVRTARVVQEAAASSAQRLLLPAVDEALKAKLTEIKNLGSFANFGPCKPAAAVAASASAASNPSSSSTP